MSTQYVGRAANLPTFPSQVSISLVSAGNPAIITTGSAHGLQTGQMVDITGETVATSINGIWTVTVQDSVHFTIPLNLGAGNASPASFVQPIAFPTVQLISDGDNVQAGALNPVGQASQDELAFLLGSTGAYKLVASTPLSSGALFNDSGSSPSTSWNSYTIVLSNTWEDAGVPGATPWQIANVVVGDIVEFEVDLNWSIPAAHTSSIKLRWANFAPGGSPSFGFVTASGRSTNVAGMHPTRLRGLVAATVAGNVRFDVWAFGTSADTFNFVGDYRASFKLYRSTSVPQ